MKFCSPDEWSPFGRGGVNAYAYCAGDPVNGSDPTGHNVWYRGLSIVIGIISTAAAAKAATSEGRAQVDWAIVAGMTGILAAGFGLKAYRSRPSSKGATWDTTSDSSAQPIVKPGKKGSSQSGKAPSVKEQEATKRQMEDAARVSKDLDAHNALLESAHARSGTPESYKRGLTDRYGVPLQGTPRVDVIRDPGKPQGSSLGRY